MVEIKYNYKTTPFKHQLDALARSANKKNFAYFMEMGCVDEETEFLTQRGWVRFKDFNLDKWERPLLVAQAVPDPRDPYNWGYEFVEPISFIKKPAYDWVRLRGRKTRASELLSAPFETDIWVTPDHRIPAMYSWETSYNTTTGYKSNWYKEYLPDMTADYPGKMFNREPREPELSVRKAGINFFRNTPRGCLGFQSEYFVPDAELMALSEYEMRFMIAVMADGTFPNKYDDKVDFYFMKHHKAARMRELCSKAGIPYAYERKVRGSKTLYVFHMIAPMRCKYFSERWYSLPQDRLNWIASEVFYWDGWMTNICKDGMAEYYSISRDSIDFIQYALMSCGISCNMRLNPRDNVFTLRTSTTENDRVNMYVRQKYRMPVYKTVKRPIANSILQSETIQDDKMSYCFRVPTGYLLLRRNNKIFVSGNSGKTKVMIDNIGVLHNGGHISGALVLAPKGVYRNWSEKEIPTHLPDDIKREILVWDASASAGRKEKLFKQIKDWDGKTLQFLVFNIESLISEKGRKLIVDFIRRHDGNVFALVDESTCIKNHKAKRTKAAIDLGSKCKVRRIATGSPVTNSPLDLYSQCAFLDRSLLGSGSYYAFKNTYANIERVPNRQGQHYEKILSYKNLDKLSEKLNKFSYRVTKKECLDLPDKIYTTRDVELSPEQEKIYREMYDYQYALLKKDEQEFHEMSAQVILTKLLRLHQVLCGTFVSDDGDVVPIPNNRLTALKEVLEETSGKAIIWATYLADIEAIKKMLTEEYGEDSFVTYYGATSSEDRVKAIELFQDESSPVRFFLGNVQTAGRGITLTAASTVIYYSNNFSLELRQQSEDRAHRLGQKNKVTYVDLVVRGSLDEKIIKSLIEKRNIANEILKDDLDSWISLERA